MSKVLPQNERSLRKRNLQSYHHLKKSRNTPGYPLEKNCYDDFEPKDGQRKQVRQTASPRLKTQLEIGKGYNDTPWGKKNAYAACCHYGDTILRRWAKKYREMSKGGTIRNKVVGVDEMKEKSRVLKANLRVGFPESEKLLVEKFSELRKVGIPVNGPYLRAKMLE